MYESGIDVMYEVAEHDDHDRVSYGPHQKVTLPGWCAGDVPMALTLYLFGNRTFLGLVRIVDWQPHEETIDDSAREFECPDDCVDTGHLHEVWS